MCDEHLRGCTHQRGLLGCPSRRRLGLSGGGERLGVSGEPALDGGLLLKAGPGHSL